MKKTIQLNKSLNNQYWLNTWDSIRSQLLIVGNSDSKQLIKIIPDDIHQNISQKLESILHKTIPKMIKWIENWLVDQIDGDFNISIKTTILTNPELDLSSISAFIPLKLYHTFLFVISCDLEIAEELIISFDISPNDPDKELYMIDVVSEVTNIIIGNAMQWLSDDNHPPELGYPISLSSSDIKLSSQHSKWLNIEFHTEKGNFNVYLLLSQNINTDEII